MGVNKESYLILETLPAEYDSRVKAMEIDEKPTEDYSDIGGLDKQIKVRHGLHGRNLYSQSFHAIGSLATREKNETDCLDRPYMTLGAC